MEADMRDPLKRAHREMSQAEQLKKRAERMRPRVVGRSKLATRVRDFIKQKDPKIRKNFLEGEDLEQQIAQLDEVSRKLLGRYLKKSSVMVSQDRTDWADKHAKSLHLANAKISRRKSHTHVNSAGDDYETTKAKVGATGPGKKVYIESLVDQERHEDPGNEHRAAKKLKAQRRQIKLAKKQKRERDE